MTALYTQHALLPNGWADRVRIEIDAFGMITDVRVGVEKGDALAVPAPLIPGMVNMHSHVFQRAMAGLTERAGAHDRGMNVWRKVMYKHIANMTPEALEAIATHAYIEMLKGGYTSVGEFHFLHHDEHSRPYANRAEMSERLIAAAGHSGIAMTLFPVFYAHAGFGGQPPSPTQMRFVSSVESYLGLVEDLLPIRNSSEPLQLGVGFHSLRSVTSGEMRKILALLPRSLPVQIRVAVQAREVEHCLAWSQKRPVDWLMDSLPIDDRWALIHASHASYGELDRIIASGAAVGICPVTEANMGDGVFEGRYLIEKGGSFGIGSGSQAAIDPARELSMLDYGQRLSERRRAIMAVPRAVEGVKDAIDDEQTISAGLSLYLSALKGGAKAIAQPVGAIEKGKRADLVVLDSDHPLLDGRRGDAILDRWIFAGGENLVRHVMVAGKWVIRDRRHVNDTSARRYLREATKGLFDL